MPKKPTLSQITNAANNFAAINTNFDRVADAFNNTLSLDGSLPNSMQADLDMDDNDILNVNSLSTEAIRIGGTNVTATQIEQAANTALAKQYRDEAESFAALAGAVPYESRAAAEAATVDADVDYIYVTHRGHRYLYKRDASGTALSTNDATVNWSPEGDVYPEHFGAQRDNSTEDTTAILAAITYAEDTTGEVKFRGGRYVANQLVLNSLRAMKLSGTAPGTEVVNTDDTFIQLPSGATTGFLIDFRSCSYITVENITFFSNNATHDSLVRTTCNQTSPAAGLSPFANTGLEFKNVVMAVTAGNASSIATLDLKDIIMSSFVRCNISGTNAVYLGRDTSTDPVSGLATIPDGRAVNILFHSCIFRGNVIRERITNVDYKNNYVGKNTNPVSGSSYQVGVFSTYGNEEIRGERFIGNSVDSDGVNYAAAVLFNTPQTPPTNIEYSLEARGNQITSVGIGFRLQSGVAHVTNNSFARVTLTGASTYIGVELVDGLDKFTVEDNNYDGLMLHNTGSITSYAVLDSRTAFEDDKYLLNRRKTADQTLTNNNYTSVLTRTIDNFDGGLIEASYTITITSAIDSVFTARLLLNGTPIPGTYARETTNTTSTKTFTLSLPPTLIKTTPQSRSSSTTLSLEVQQAAGATYATIRSDAYALGGCTASIKLVTS